MRILSVFQTFAFFGKDVEASKIKVMAKLLKERGFELTILSVDYAKFSGIHRSEGDGIEMVHLGRIKRFGATTLSLNVLPFCLKELRNFDLVHVFGLYDLLGVTVGFFCRRWNIPYLLEPMGMYRPVVRSKRKKQYYHWLFGRNLVAGARRVIANSEQEERELLESGVPRAKVVLRRNGVDAPERLPERGAFRLKWNIAADATVILFLGRLAAIKSLDLLLEAYADCLSGREWPQKSVLVLAGPEEGDGYRERLNRICARRGLGERALFTGPLYGDAKWHAYRDADAFVLPSQYESFGNVAAEAMIAQTPVVVTDRCGIAPIVKAGRAGLVVEHNRDALRQGITQIVCDNALREELRGRCAEMARQLSWEEPINLMEKLYRESSARSQVRVQTEVSV